MRFRHACHTRWIEQIESRLLLSGAGAVASAMAPWSMASAASTVTVSATIDLPAIADGYVRDGTYAGQSFGQSATLEVKKVYPPGYTREAYFRFDLTGVASADQIDHATLRISGKLLSATSPALSFGLFAVTSGGAWSEPGLTWNAKPATAATALANATVTSTSAAVFEFDVTAWVKQQKLAGATGVSFSLKGNGYSEGWAGFASRESAVGKPSLSITSTSTQPPTTGFGAHINFQPAWAPTPAGYFADTGGAFGDRAGGLAFGWNDTAPYGVDRNLSNAKDQRYDTFNYLQKPGSATTWELAVPDGAYSVHVVTGDPLYYGSINRVNVEGVLAVGATTTSAARWAEGNVTVMVTDGRLTITAAAGASNAKICFIDVASVETGGWTPISPSADSRVIYVDNTPGGPGKDTNNGLSAATPVFSWAKGVSLLRNGYPDQILLKRGTTQKLAVSNWKLSGRSDAEPIVIGAYGSLSMARPKFVTGAATNGFSTVGTGVSYLNVMGLEFTPGIADTTAINTTGFYIPGKASDVLIEDCVFRAYQANVVFVNGTGDDSDITLRRSQVLDAYGANSSIPGQEYAQRSEGLYADGVAGLTIEENLFDHNGWNESVAGAGPNMYSQNIYLNIHNTHVTVKDNLIANASGHGLQARAGGIVTGNVFINNPVGMSFGYVDTSAALKGGVTGEIADNVFLGTRDIPWDDGEWAMEIANTTPERGVAIRDNVVSGFSTGDKAAIRFRVPTKNANLGEDVGLNDVTFDANIVYGWSHALSLDPEFVPGGSGHTGFNGMSVRLNQFQNGGVNPLIQHDNVFDGGTEGWEQNIYSGNVPADGWFRVNSAGTLRSTDVAGWQVAVEPTARADKQLYVDPIRSAATYNATLGGVATTAGYLTQVRSQSRGNWRDTLTAEPLRNYVKAGFSVVPISG